MLTWLAGLIAIAATILTYYSCVLLRLRRRGCAGRGSSAQDADLDARDAAASRRSALRLFIGLTAAVAVVAVVGYCGSNLSRPRASHATDALLTSLDSEFTVNAEHAHLVDGSSKACHESLTTAVLPRSGTASIGIGAVMAVVANGGWLARPPVVAGRGPPRAALGTALTGQDLLTRFCRARR
jgi:hypothetical protein